MYFITLGQRPSVIFLGHVRTRMCKVSFLLANFRFSSRVIYCYDQNFRNSKQQFVPLFLPSLFPTIYKDSLRGHFEIARRAEERFRIGNRVLESFGRSLREEDESLSRSWRVILGDVRARHAFLATRSTFTEKLRFCPYPIRARTGSCRSIKHFSFLLLHRGKKKEKKKKKRIDAFYPMESVKIVPSNSWTRAPSVRYLSIEHRAKNKRINPRALREIFEYTAKR